MRHRTTSVISIGLVLLFGSTLAACGGGDLGTQGEPDISLGDGLRGNFARIEAPERLKDQGTPISFQIESSGKAPLEITTLEFTAANGQELPERLLFQGPATGTSCTFSRNVPISSDENGSCGDEAFCKVGDGKCHTTQLPETPITLEPDNAQNFTFLLAASDRAEMVCPDPPSSRPETFVESTSTWNRIKRDYCGELRIETNARTDSGPFSDGNTRIYLLADTGSGQINVPGGGVSFEDVRPGTTESQSFTVENNGLGTLTINQINVETNAQYLDIEPKNFPVDIPGEESSGGAGSEEWTVTLDIPSGLSPDEIPSNSTLKILSSAANAPDSGAPVGITISTPSAGPVIELLGSDDTPKTAASFKETETQTIRIGNDGGSLMVISSIDFSLYRDCPSNNPSCDVQTRLDKLKSAYSMKLAGTSISPGNLSGEKRSIQTTDDPRPLEITYDTNVQSPPLGYLVLEYRGSSSGRSRTARIALLGPRDGGLLDMFPDSLNFRHNDKEQTRTLLFRNQGTKPVEMEPPKDETLGSEFDIVDGEGNSLSNWTVPADGLKSVRVKFLGTSKDKTFAKSDVGFQSLEEALQKGLAFNIFTVKNQPTVDVSLTTTFGEMSPPRVGSVLEFKTSKSRGEGSSYQWVVLERPSGSRVFRTRPVETVTGETSTYTIRPDETGRYRVGATVRPEGGGETQVFKSFQVKPKASGNEDGGGSGGG